MDLNECSIAHHLAQRCPFFFLISKGIEEFVMS
eukprot:COSAG06_NODE_59585_length_273_cov_1.781609_1_plen_32_part_10